MDTRKIKYLQTIGMHRMFLNVAIFSVTNRSISSTKKTIDFFKHFYLILGHPVFAIQDRVISTRNYKKHICGLNRSLINVGFAELKGKPLNTSFLLAPFWLKANIKKRHDIFAKIIHMNLAVKFNLLKDTQPHYIYKPESCLENDNYKLYFDRTVLTDIHIQHNRPDIIILNKQQKQAYLLDIAVPNSHNITQIYRMVQHLPFLRLHV
jgi:hypothetical protein